MADEQKGRNIVGNAWEKEWTDPTTGEKTPFLSFSIKKDIRAGDLVSLWPNKYMRSDKQDPHWVMTRKDPD